MAGLLGAVLLTSVIALGCSGDSDSSPSSRPAAAQQVDASNFLISSPSFTEIRPRRRIPLQNSCYGENTSPPLDWSGAPVGAESLALIVEDVDNEAGVWVHWVLFNIPPDATGLAEGVSTSTDVLPDGTTQGTNDYKTLGWFGPCIPKKAIDFFGGPRHHTGPHAYYFRLYALDTSLELGQGVTKEELLDAVEGHVLAQTETIGKHQIRQEFVPN